MEGGEGMTLDAAVASLPKIESSVTVGVTTTAESSITKVPPTGVTVMTVSGVAAVPASPVSVALGNSGIHVKKRGRPRKYGLDGTVSLALSPILATSSVSRMGVGLGEISTIKRGRGRTRGSIYNQDFDFPGGWPGCTVGANFIPHVITVAAGEDVTMKIISFSQQGPCAVCILSANGAISNVTLRQPDSSGGTLTYEGRFEILSLSGSFMPTDIGGTRNRVGGMSVSLASPDGRVIGGGVDGLLIAATPVQVVIGSFISSIRYQRPKKPKMEVHRNPVPVSAVPICSGETNGQHSPHQPRILIIPKQSVTPPGFRGDHWMPLHGVSDTRNSTTDINLSFPGG